MRLRRFPLILGAGLLLAAPAFALDWSADASYSWVKNLSRTSYAADRENAQVSDGSVTALWHRQLAPAWSGSAEGDAGFEQVPDFPGLDSVHAGLKLDLHRKFGLGPFAPVFGGTLAATRYDLHERGRSNWKTEAGIYFKQRLTDAWRIAASGGWEEDYARDKPFDIVNRRAALETSWDVTDWLQLSAGASRLWGELTANANEDIYAQALAGGFGAAVRDYYNTVPYEHSTAFDTDWVAYRIAGRANICWVSASFSLGENTSVPLRYESVDVLNRANVHYRTDFLSLSLSHRF